MNFKLKQLTVIAAGMMVIFCSNAFAATAVEDCKSLEAIEETQRLADLKMAHVNMPADQYQQEYNDIVRESAAVKKQCEQDPAFVKPLTNKQAKAD